MEVQGSQAQQLVGHVKEVVAEMELAIPKMPFLTRVFAAIANAFGFKSSGLPKAHNILSDVKAALSKFEQDPSAKVAQELGQAFRQLISASVIKELDLGKDWPQLLLVKDKTPVESAHQHFEKTGDVKTDQLLTNFLSGLDREVVRDPAAVMKSGAKFLDLVADSMGTRSLLDHEKKLTQLLDQKANESLKDDVTRTGLDFHELVLVTRNIATRKLYFATSLIETGDTYKQLTENVFAQAFLLGMEKKMDEDTSVNPNQKAGELTFETGLTSVQEVIEGKGEPSLSNRGDLLKLRQVVDSLPKHLSHQGLTDAIGKKLGD